MSESSATPTEPPHLSIEEVIYVLGDPARWAILKELVSGEPRMVNELAVVARKRQTAASKHVIALMNMGVVERVRRLYQLADRYRTGPGQTTIDFGHCLVRFL